jgi:hypothetical protein
VLVVPAATVWARMRIDRAETFIGRLSILGLVLAGSLVIVWFVVYWLLCNIFHIGIRARDAMRASWGMMLLPLAPPVASVVSSVARQWVALHAQVYPFFVPERSASYVSAAIVAGLGALLLFQTCELSLKSSHYEAAWRSLRSRNRLLLMFALLIVSIPVLSEKRQAAIFDFTGLFYVMDWLLPYALLIGAVVFVRLANPTDHFRLTTGETQMGALLFAWYVSGHSASLLFVPVPLLIAWYLFSKWLLLSTYPPMASTTSVLTKLLAERRAQARAEDVEKGLDKKLSEGDLKLHDYKVRLLEAQEEAKSAANALRSETGGTEPRVLSNGPESGPFANARIGVLYGFVISLPFQVFTLVGFMRRTYTDFPILEVAYALVFSTTTWVLMAAVFGYFYHLIRGRNGFEKALCFSLAVVLPSLPLRLIAGESVLERSQLLDMVQVIAFVLVLALVAFDLRTLTRKHRDWRDLLTLYGFASAAYGSTIALAIGSTLASKEVLLRLWGWVTGHSAQ